MVTRFPILFLALAISASAQVITPPNLVNRNGLVGRWLVPGKQTDNVALPTTVLDDSGKGNHGTTVASPNYGIIYSRPAMTFNGSSQYVTSRDSGYPSGTGAYTIACWFLVSQNLGININQSMVEWGTRSTGNMAGFGYGSFGSITSTNSLYISQYGGAVQLKKPVNDGTWHHGCATHTGPLSYTIWLDGRTAPNTTLGDITTSITLSGKLYFGASTDATAKLAGNLRDIRIYNRVLSALEIRAIYQGQQ